MVSEIVNNKEPDSQGKKNNTGHTSNSSEGLLDYCQGNCRKEPTATIFLNDQVLNAVNLSTLKNYVNLEKFIENSLMINAPNKVHDTLSPAILYATRTSG
jgi:hypothetical protein